MAFWLWSVPSDALAPALRTATLALRRQGARRLADVAPGDRIFVYVPGRRVLAAMVEAVGAAFEDATAAPDAPRHAPHRLRVRPLVVLPDEARVPYDGFAPHLHVLGEYAHLPTPEARFRAVAQRVLHRLPTIDGKVLEFVVRARAGADPEALMAAVEAVREARGTAREHVPGGREHAGELPAPAVAEPPKTYAAPWDRADALERLVAAVEARGFVFEPADVAGFVVALRTKPFAVLSGVTGVGKSRLPVLVAEATGAAARVLPVRPDWTDPAETVGYTDLSGRFRPGAVLRAARDAAADPGRAHVLVLDEMNLGRPEHFLAEVLSRMEARRADGSTDALVTEALADRAWAGVGLPPTLLLVGTVNVDEAGHALSARVLDRAFAFSLHPADLSAWRAGDAADAPVEAWPADAWVPRARRLAELGPLTDGEAAEVERAVAAVVALGARLAPAGLALGYRTRDEVALFCLHALDVRAAFRTRAGDDVDPLDVALAARVVARAEGAGSGRAASAALRDALAWASGRDGTEPGDSLAGAPFPRLAAGLARALVDPWA